jgi:hypothetical protein
MYVWLDSDGYIYIYVVFLLFLGSDMLNPEDWQVSNVNNSEYGESFSFNRTLIYCQTFKFIRQNKVCPPFLSTVLCTMM